jgi:hypothetical protein
MVLVLTVRVSTPPTPHTQNDDDDEYDEDDMMMTTSKIRINSSRERKLLSHYQFYNTYTITHTHQSSFL